MKRFLLVLFAVSPFAIGYWLNYALQKFNWAGGVPFMISILFLVYWFFIGYFSVRLTNSVRKSLLIGNSFAALVLLLNVFQDVLLHRFFLNEIGIATQNFYLPMIPLSVKIGFFIPHRAFWGICILAFILMAAVYYLGYSFKQKRLNRYPAA
ncbi:MAG: hypothetical protein K0Q85_1186 [Caproiciproducens sp.]|nr:hypothetical protein [Caproiciproducens sp.]